MAGHEVQPGQFDRREVLFRLSRYRLGRTQALGVAGAQGEQEQFDQCDVQPLDRPAAHQRQLGGRVQARCQPVRIAEAGRMMQGNQIQAELLARISQRGTALASRSQQRQRAIRLVRHEPENCRGLGVGSKCGHGMTLHFRGAKPELRELVPALQASTAHLPA